MPSLRGHRREPDFRAVMLERRYIRAVRSHSSRPLEPRGGRNREAITSHSTPWWTEHVSGVMADVSLYLTNVGVSLGQTMDSEEKTSGAANYFESVQMGEPGSEEGRVRVPRRTIYFASGETMEEYSTDEEEDEETPMKKDVVTVDPEEEEEEENRLSTEAELQFNQQHVEEGGEDNLPLSHRPAMEQPPASFVNISFDLEPEPPLATPDTSRVPAPLSS
ncbi:hypothetical protein CRUP_034332 [Coryphaenoides rupestris]|nr:hypothetical protein CRUP_034332 [Coryphaenoides rupestris]